MRIVFDPFWKTLKARKMTQYRLIRYHQISAGQLDRMRKNEHVSTYTIEQFCRILDCGINDIIEMQDEEGKTMPFSVMGIPEPVLPETGMQEAAAARETDSSDTDCE